MSTYEKLLMRGTWVKMPGDRNKGMIQCVSGSIRSGVPRTLPLFHLAATPDQKRDYATIVKRGKLMDIFQQEGEELRRTIVLVEDDPANAEVLALLLQTENAYDVLSFQEGAEVLANLDNIKRRRPALFLLDYQLSGMTALDLYEQLHSIEGLEKVPAIIITAITLAEEEKERLQHLGLNLVQKPYNIDDLLLTIEQAAPSLEG
jgi:CheY-like chemotaxis protein